jgi:hypothetical protein
VLKAHRYFDIPGFKEASVEAMSAVGPMSSYPAGAPAAGSLTQQQRGDQRSVRRPQEQPQQRDQILVRKPQDQPVEKAARKRKTTSVLKDVSNKQVPKRKKTKVGLAIDPSSGKVEPSKKFHAGTIQVIPSFSHVPGILHKIGYVFRDTLFCFPGKDPVMCPRAVEDRDYFVSEDAFRAYSARAASTLRWTQSSAN